MIVDAAFSYFVVACTCLVVMTYMLLHLCCQHCSGIVDSSVEQETVGVDTSDQSLNIYSSHIVRRFREVRVRLPAAVAFAVYVTNLSVS